MRRLLREVLVERGAARLDELADVVSNRALVPRDGDHRALHPGHAIFVPNGLIQHLIRVRHHPPRGEAILQPRVRHDNLPVRRRLLVVAPLLVRGHKVGAVGGISLAHTCAKHLEFVADGVGVLGRVVDHSRGDTLEVDEHLLHAGEVLGSRVVAAAVVELRGVVHLRLRGRRVALMGPITGGRVAVHRADGRRGRGVAVGGQRRKAAS